MAEVRSAQVTTGAATDIEVRLYEDNAGGLYLICGSTCYVDLEYTDSSLREDAQAIAEGLDSDWTVRQYASEQIMADIRRDGMPHIATAAVRGGRVEVRAGDDAAAVGYAGKRYLGEDFAVLEAAAGGALLD